MNVARSGAKGQEFTSFELKTQFWKKLKDQNIVGGFGFLFGVDFFFSVVVLCFYGRANVRTLRPANAGTSAQSVWGRTTHIQAAEYMGKWCENVTYFNLKFI